MAQIYVVEDDDNIREIEEYVLKNAGYNVKGYACAADFYNAVGGGLPDMVLLDIMFPMITSVSELTRIREICEVVKAELKSEGIAYSENVELGIMIETPAAAVISDLLAPMVDFFSVGTNDLTQYTLACDRQNPDIEAFCDTHHEAILRLIEMSTKNAHAHGAWIGICGELGADLTLTETFLRMGIDGLSVSPGFVLRVRDKVRSIDLSK